MNNKGFEQYKISEELLRALEGLGYKAPTLVQELVIPAILTGKDVVVKSQTGSGKTASFAIPIIETVDWEENLPQALVITPTRELAIQVKEDFFNIGRFKRIKVSALIGKAPFRIQEKELKQKTHIVVGTPGRIIDHMERNTVDFSAVKTIIIDEADEMLRMGFIDEVQWIMDHLPENRVTALFSATFPDDISSLCKHYMKDPETISIAESDPVADRVEQGRYEVQEVDKEALLVDLLTIENPDVCMIFCNTQKKVDELAALLEDREILSDRIHGGMEQSDRLKVMDQFKRGTFRYLVATDVAARGIDIDHVNLVINYDVPNTTENYVHRIGRTGRKGQMGKAVTFVAPWERKMMEEIQIFIDKEIPEVIPPSDEEVLSAVEAFEDKHNQAPEIKETKGEKLSEGIVKIHINAGKKTKMRAVDIVGTLCSIEGITAQDIGIINILDISTYVEVLNDKGEMVLKALQDKPIKGRLRRVSRADK